MLEVWRRAHARAHMVGWNFAALGDRLSADEPPWDFEAECLRAMASARRVLDMGTGGGERLLALIARLERDGHARRAITATEGWDPNVAIAVAALEPYGIEVARYDSDTMVRMPFSDASFELVVNRHESYDAPEVQRVLTPGGLFLTQQVDGSNAKELRGWFGGGISHPDVTIYRHRADAEAAGLEVVTAAEWEGHMRLEDAETLVEYLGMVPFEVPDFRVEEHADMLTRLDARRPIVVTQRRFWIAARKPCPPPRPRP